jgi:arginyl-tRNA synthetase
LIGRLIEKIKDKSEEWAQTVQLLPCSFCETASRQLPVTSHAREASSQLGQHEFEPLVHYTPISAIIISNMLQNCIELVQTQLGNFIKDHYQIEDLSLIYEKPPRIEFGDVAFPFPFQLAKVLRRSPREIAQEVVELVGNLDGVSRLEAAGAGFVNVFFDRPSFFEELYAELDRPVPTAAGRKLIIEHTNINPNKAAHIGHLRNAILGDSFVKMLRGSGRQVEVQNYIDNTGVQVADVVVGFHHIRRLSAGEVEAIEDPFDYYCWDLYAEVSEWYEADRSRLHFRQETLAAIEEGGNDFAALGEYVANRIVKAHLQTMERIGVRYDVLPRESEILHLRFWDEAFELLKQKKAIYFANDGQNEGCWVMHLPGENGQQDEDKIIVRSNGTVTYVGKDIAYQLWKFGLLGKTFHYRPFQTYPDGEVVWMTAVDQTSDNEPKFGGGDQVYNVIDVRQSYLQKVVVQGLRSLGFEKEADNSVHFSYEMVALSPRCCQDLGINLTEQERSKPYVEVSGRKGLGVKADDLIDKLLEKTLAEVTTRQSELPLELRQEIAHKIAVGALRYFMLKYTRNSVIAFDFEEALSFEGETGPYLQYSVVRVNNIFKKLAAKEKSWSERQWTEDQKSLWKSNALTPMLEDNETWGLILHIARIGDSVEQAVETLELSGVARHAFSLAQQFNLFYHKHHILSEEDKEKQTFYLTIADSARNGLVQLLDLLGISVPERM